MAVKRATAKTGRVNGSSYPLGAKAASPHFSAGLFAFLADLRENNDREWFAANKARYEREVKGPILRFIGDFAPYLSTISKEFVADPRPIGGSMFRIHRDTRFARDKAPYKTNAGAHFRHRAGANVHAPGFYLHLAPDEVFAAAGIWHPNREATEMVRQGIATKPKQWLAAVAGEAFETGAMAMAGETLQRPPRGYDAGHPLITDLKRKDFIAVAQLDEATACRADFPEILAAVYAAAAPLTQFLTRAVGLPW